MTQLPASNDPASQRARAKRTVAVLAVVAVSIYVAFVLHAMLSR